MISSILITIAVYLADIGLTGLSLQIAKTWFGLDLTKIDYTDPALVITALWIVIIMVINPLIWLCLMVACILTMLFIRFVQWVQTKRKDRKVSVVGNS